MFKQELPLMFPGDADVQAVRAAMFDPFEYLVARKKDGLLKTDFKQALGRVSYSGHAGTWGVKEEHFETAMKIGRPVFRQMNAANPDYISSDCSLAGMHIEQGIARTAEPAAESKPARKAHPLTLFRMAYGLPEHGDGAVLSRPVHTENGD